MNDLTPDRILAIEAEARALRAREFRRLVLAFAAMVRRTVGRGAATRAA